MTISSEITAKTSRWIWCGTRKKISWEHLYCHVEVHSFVNWLEDNPSFAYNVTPRRLLNVYQHYAYSLDHQ